MAAERRVEPWPFALAGLLLAMIAGSLAFYWTAVRHPDARVVEHPLAAPAAPAPRPAG